MTKKTASILLLGGLAVSLYDAFTNNSLYGPGKPLANMRWKIYTTASGTNWYVSISDLAAIAGAFFYFGGSGKGKE